MPGIFGQEAPSLLLSDLYLDELHPRLVARGKGSRESSVYLPHQAERALHIYLDQRPVVASEYVFLSYLAKGLSTTAIHKRLMGYRQAAEVSLTAHPSVYCVSRPMGGGLRP